MRVLVVDDDEAFLAMIQAALEEEGYQVVTATDGSAALALVARLPPEAIILDIRMPRGDGRAFARAYERLRGPHAPIIVISGVPGANEASIPGARTFLSKPFELERLFGLLRDLAPQAQRA